MGSIYGECVECQKRPFLLRLLSTFVCGHEIELPKPRLSKKEAIANLEKFTSEIDHEIEIAEIEAKVWRQAATVARGTILQDKGLGGKSNDFHLACKHLAGLFENQADALDPPSDDETED